MILPSTRAAVEALAVAIVHEIRTGSIVGKETIAAAALGTAGKLKRLAQDPSTTVAQLLVFCSSVPPEHHMSWCAVPVELPSWRGALRRLEREEETRAEAAAVGRAWADELALHLLPGEPWPGNGAAARARLEQAGLLPNRDDWFELLGACDGAARTAWAQRSAAAPTETAP